MFQVKLADSYLNPFTFVGYRNDRFFTIQILILFGRLRNGADGHISSLGHLWFHPTLEQCSPKW